MADVYPRRFLAQRHNVQRGSCFVLMPFSSAFDAVYAALRNAFQSPDLDMLCRRADDFRAPNILETILLGIAKSEYVVADLTSSNPNVFYELGIAHCVKDPAKVLLLAQDISFVPFDLRHLRCILYEPTPEGLAKLREDLVATFHDVAPHAFRFRLHEGKRFEFGRKIVGRDNNLFQLVFQCEMLGYGAIKLYIVFHEYSMSAIESPTDPQFVFLSHDQPMARLDYVPWDLHVAEFTEKEALLVLERR